MILVALAASACAPPGYVYDTGNFIHPHPTPAFCQSEGQMYDYNTEQCIAPPPPASAQMPPPTYPPQAYSPPTAAPVAFSNQRETYEQDKIWNDRIEHGACTRLHDRRTDSPADEADCNQDYAATPICVSYKGFASAWYDMANAPNPVVSNPSFAIANLNDIGNKHDPADPPYDQSPQFHDVLRRLLNVTFSPARNKWGTRDQFADYAYKICMEGHPF